MFLVSLIFFRVIFFYFANIKSFTSLFKEMYGVTPHVYRENHS